jgi:pyrroline-5-carboxylate reductase
MSVTLPAMAIIGTGKMGGAILDGVLQPGVTVTSLRVTTQSDDSAEVLRTRGLTAASLDIEPDANAWAVAGAKIVIIAVKPARVIDAIRSVTHVLEKDAVVVSVAAGITTEVMEKATSNPVVRAMPNTPTQIGQGVTGLAAGSRASDEQVAEIERVFGLLGQVVVLPEEQMNALSAISGSGPAYLFYIAEKLIDVATSHGFTADQASVMVHGTLLGAAALLDQSGDTPAALRSAVTSPGGTTEQAIAEFDEAGLGGILADAIERAIARAEEMGRC